MAYIAYNNLTNALLEISDNPIDASRYDPLIFTTFTINGTAQELASMLWNTSMLRFDPKHSVVSKLDFLGRFTVTERIGIRNTAKTDAVVEDFMDLLNKAEHVDLASANTIAGLGYLVSIGLITAARRDAILAY